MTKKSRPVNPDIKKAVISQMPPNRIRVHSPYDPDLIAEYKRIPYGDRQYDPATHDWIFRDNYIEEILTILRRFFNNDNIIVDIEEEVENPFEAVMAILPEAHIDKIYKALAQAVHPDVGGTDELMKNLNEAYATIKNKKVKP